MRCNRYPGVLYRLAFVPTYVLGSQAQKMMFNYSRYKVWKYFQVFQLDRILHVPETTTAFSPGSSHTSFHVLDVFSSSLPWAVTNHTTQMFFFRTIKSSRTITDPSTFTHNYKSTRIRKLRETRGIRFHVFDSERRQPTAYPGGRQFSCWRCLPDARPAGSARCAPRRAREPGATAGI